MLLPHIPAPDAFPHPTGDSVKSASLAIILLAAATGCTPRVAAQTDQLATRNVILVTIDGLRWQEVFFGADERFMDAERGGVENIPALREAFWRDTPAQRRRALLPFFWSTVVEQGLVYGNRREGSEIEVTNGLNFSYPGYNELLAGYPDDRIDSNQRRMNPNVTVLEWIDRQPGFGGGVAAFASWNVFPYIINTERSDVFVNAGWEPYDADGDREANRLLNALMLETPREWEDVRFDAYTFYAALDYLRRWQPRLLYLALDEPDDWAHGRHYDRYLKSARRADQFLETLWAVIDSMPAYRDRTTLIIASDHGRGDGAADWTDHGREVEGAEFIWLAAMGPDTPALGERENVPSLVQGQIASTVAAFLGLDYRTDVPAAAPAIRDLVRPPAR